MIGRSWKEFLSVLERKTADFYVFDCPLSLCLLSPCLLFVPVRTYSFQKHSRTISKNNILLRISKRFNSQSMTNNSVGSPVQSASSISSIDQEYTELQATDNFTGKFHPAPGCCRFGKMKIQNSMQTICQWIIFVRLSEDGSLVRVVKTEPLPFACPTFALPIKLAQISMHLADLR